MTRFFASVLLVSMLLTVLPFSVSADQRELTDADLLAFCVISSFDFKQGETVGAALDRLSLRNALWDRAQEIDYAQLCKHIMSYRVRQVFDTSLLDGFYAVLFADKNGNGVLALRASAPPSGLEHGDIDAMHDWLQNDFPMELGNTMGTQYPSALEAYRYAAQACTTVLTTGHSLGGAWADILSAMYGCRGVSFNAVSALDVLYRHDPWASSTLFEGTNRWNFVDHTNQYDILAGMFETYLATEIKPYIAHKSNYACDEQAMQSLREALLQSDLPNLSAFLYALLSTETAQCHSLQSIVTVDSAGDVCLTETVSAFAPQSGIIGEMASAGSFAALGTSGDDVLTDGTVLLASGALLGGNGDDTLFGGILDDVLIGGNGNDTLDGNWGNDCYLYRRGDGTDLITDVSGSDALILHGFSGSEIRTETSTDGIYITVLADGVPIVSVLRGIRDKNASDFRIVNGERSQSIAHLFGSVSYKARMVIGGDAAVHITDRGGNTLYTVTGTQITPYGNIYVTEGKTVLELCGEYSVKLTGVSGGTMELLHLPIADGEFLSAQTIRGEVPDEPYIATIGKDDEGNLFWHIRLTERKHGDVNGDGKCSALDYMMLKRTLLGKYKPTAAQRCASDINGDQKLSALDYMMLKRILLGTHTESKR